MKTRLLNEIRTHRIIAILRGVPDEKILPVAKALWAGGIRLLEITFNQKSGEDRNTLQAVHYVRSQMPDQLYVGAGTVMSPAQAEEAAKAGAQFILAPDTNPAVISAANEHDIAAVPGALTPTEIARAYRYGAAAVKLFPAGNFGIDYIKAVTAPLSYIPLIAVGGVDVQNAAQFLQAGMLGVGVGSNMTPNTMIQSEDYDGLSALAKQYADTVNQMM